jgi:ABC-2 type transport system permease protein
MTGSFFAEVLKLRKRPAVWVLGVLWIVVVVLFLYLLPAVIFTLVFANAPPEAGPRLEAQLSPLSLENLAPYLLQSLFPGLGTAVALILGVLTAGSEYGWGTLKIILSQRASRLGVLSGKLLALGGLLLLFVLVAFLGAALSSLAVALLSGTSPAPPSAMELLAGVGAGALILVVWATFGFVLATLFRGTALAVGLGLIYAFVVEPVFSGLSALSETLQTITGFLPGENTTVLSVAFVGNPAFEGGGPDPARSALVLIAYTVVFLLIAALVFRQRDVT